MKAEQMFEKMGYVRYQVKNGYSYYNELKHKLIVFNIHEKTVACSYWYDGYFKAGMNYQELKAAIKQLEEEEDGTLSS